MRKTTRKKSLPSSRSRRGRSTQRPKDVTDIALFVRVSRGDVVNWDRSKIVEALLRETRISAKMAERISREVEKTIVDSKIKFITAPLIREVVNEKLIEHRLEEERKQHTRLGLPIFDVEQMMVHKNRENANVPHGPESSNLVLAESIKKQYALLRVFAPEISTAHERGDIHLHNLGMIDRPYCSGNSLEYIKRFGLNLPNAISIAKPPKHPEVLIGQMIKFSAALQGVFSGAIGWDAVNLFFAPFLVGIDDKQMEQLAQMLVFEFAQQAVARGGQSIFSDLNLYWEIPRHFRDVPAIGPGGRFTGNEYEDYVEEARRFVNALFRVYIEGDAFGRPFFFPKPEVHITEDFFSSEAHDDFLRLVAATSSEMGNPYYVFDRKGTAKISECCRLSFKLEKSDFDDAKTPWKMRYSAVQNVTVNLPRIAYKASRDDDKLFELLSERMRLIAEAHLLKKRFIERLLSLKGSGPLGLLAMDLDGESYYRMHRATFLFGMLGLNEMVQYHVGKELHESDEALKFGLKVMAFMKKEAEALGEKHGMRFVLEQTPAESTAYRLAALDLRHYNGKARKVVKGDPESGDVYYTNSTYLNVGVRMSPIERVKKEGLFHPLIEAGCLSHIWIGETRPDPDSISNFVVKTFKNTSNDQIVFSPEFTCCLDCGRRSMMEVTKQ